MASVNDTLVERLRVLWEQNLGVPVEDLDTDFLDLGGDSLLALSVAAQAIDQGMLMPLSGVLRCGTVRNLAAAVTDPALFEAELT